jgi:hypothetical protein
MARTRWKARCLIALGELWLTQGDMEKSEGFLAELDAQGFTEGFPFKKHQIRAARLKANLFFTKGEHAEGEAELKRALESAIALENPTEIWKTHYAMGSLYSGRGEGKQAKTHFHAAREVVQGIAEGLTDPQLKQGFLEAQPVRDIFTHSEGG